LFQISNASVLVLPLLQFGFNFEKCYNHFHFIFTSLKLCQGKKKIASFVSASATLNYHAELVVVVVGIANLTVVTTKIEY
jgi:hypothetical protein